MTSQTQQEHCANEDICRRYCPAHHGHNPCSYEERKGIACGFDTRSRPAPSNNDDFPRLNTQPDGCDCGDCLRYAKQECPYPGSNPTMIMCNSFLLNIKQHDATIRNQTLDEFSEWCNSTYVRNEIRDFKVYKSLRREVPESGGGRE